MIKGNRARNWVAGHAQKARQRGGSPLWRVFAITEAPRRGRLRVSVRQLVVLLAEALRSQCDLGWARPAKHERPEGAWTFSLTLGYDRRGRGFADRVFADWRFTDGPLANWRGLDNRLRMREVRSNRRSHQSQRRSANDHEFQHEVPLLRLEMSPESSLRSLRGNKLTHSHVSDLFRRLWRK